MQKSAAYKFLQIVWRSQGEYQNSHSWDRLNHAMKDALHMAILYGFRFGIDDFILICKRPGEGGFNFGYWAGVDGKDMWGEGFYSLACDGQYGPNLSAARAFEKWKNRKPFMLDGKRLFIGSRLKWPDEKNKLYIPVDVTSFSKDGTYLIACSKWDCIKNTWTEPRKNTRRLKISHDDLKNEMKRLQELEKTRESNEHSVR